MAAIGRRGKGGGLWGACLAVLALTVLLLFVATPSSTQLDLVADPTAAAGRAHGVPLAAAVGKSARFLRKHAAKAAALRASMAPESVAPVEPRPAPQPVASADAGADPSSYVPPAREGDDGGLFDMSTP